MKKTLLFSLLVFLMFFSCKKHQPHFYTFYYKKKNFALTPAEKSILQDAEVPYLYTRFFDVNKEKGFFTFSGAVSKDSTFQTDKKIVPVISVNSVCFQNIKGNEILSLAENIHNRTEALSQELQLNTEKEIQIDCDWTPETKDHYFQFLNELKKISGKEISSTIRLHHVKEKDETGIPPVEKVYLICYSSGESLEKFNRKAVLNLPRLKTYLRRLDDYPIQKIDVVLPVYSFGKITFDSGEQKIVKGISLNDLKNPDFKIISENEAEVKKGGHHFGYSLKKGTKIKVKQIKDGQLDEAVYYIDRKISGYHIIYDELEGDFVENHSFKR
ncbi:MAG: hypothetical protein QM564_04195 [Bergeyella sp.]